MDRLQRQMRASALGLALVVTSVGALAATDPDRLGVTQPKDLSLLNQAINDTIKGALSSALSKVRSAKLIVASRRGSVARTVKNLLLTAESALERRDKSTALDHLTVAVVLLIDDSSDVKGQKGKPGSLLRLVALVDNLTPALADDDGLLESILAVASHTLDLADGIADGLPATAILALERIVDVLDSNFSVSQKVRLVSDNSAIAINAIRRSRAFLQAK